MKTTDIKRWAALSPLIVAVGHAWKRRVNQELTNHNISTATALPIIMLMRQEKPMRQCELAEVLGIEGPSLVRIIDGMEQSGFVERITDPSDRRARLLVLGDDGHNVGAEVEKILADLRMTMLADADPDDVDATIRVLTLLANRLGASPLDPAQT
nr:MarR family transcriptional regulator [uncultured Desulfuromonas sp.]